MIVIRLLADCGPGEINHVADPQDDPLAPHELDPRVVQPVGSLTQPDQVEVHHMAITRSEVGSLVELVGPHARDPHLERRKFWVARFGRRLLDDDWPP